MKKYLLALAGMALALSLTSCLGDNENEKIDEDWKQENADYLEEIAAIMLDGQTEYTKIVPDWEPGTFVLMKWHNDRKLTASALQPLDNSTVRIKYDLQLIDDTQVDNSYSQTTYGDSIYQTKPSSNITGMHVALTNMHVGDSVTLVVPYTSGYGVYKQGVIPAYSTLIFHVKLVSIPGYEIPVAAN